MAPGERERQRDVLLGRQGGDEVEGLEDETDPVAPQLREALVVKGRQVGIADEDGLDVSESSPAMQCSSVDFPDPDGPMIAVRRPASNSIDTSSRARTSVGPLP